VNSRHAERLVAFAAIVCLVALLARVTDVALRAPPSSIFAPPPPADVQDRDAELDVRVARGDDGRPVRDALVRVFWERRGRYYLAGTGRTDAEGRVMIGNLPRGAVWLTAEAPGLARSSTALALDGGTRSAEVALAVAASLAVTVSDEQGGALARATVLVSSGDPLPFGALTGTEGVAHFTRLGPAPWTVKASAPGYESVTQSGVEADVTLVLRRLATLEVHVVMPSGAPAPGASVVIAGSTLWPARRAETDSGGVAHIAGLLAGSYDLKAQKGDLVSETLVGYQLERGADGSATLRLGPGRLITAYVTDDDEDHPSPVGDADVVLSEGGLSSFPLSGRTAGDGTVTLGPVSNEPATLSAGAEGFVTRAAVAVPDPLDGPVRIRLLRGATLEGEVVDAKDRPVDGATIEVIGTDLSGLPVADTPMMMAFRRSHFAWSLPGPRPLIPAGELGVMPGPIPPIPPSVSSLAPELDPLADLGSADAQALEDVEPWVTGLDGRFSAKPVTPGRVRAIVRHPAYVEGISDAVTLAPGGKGKVKVVLLAGGALEGRVVDGYGRGVTDARVDLSAVRGTLERTTITASDGSFAFAAVPAEVVLSVARPEDPSKLVVKKTVEVPEGGRANVEIELPAPRDALRIVVQGDSGEPIEGAQVSVLSIDPSAPLRQTLFSNAEGAVEVPDARGLALRVVVEASGWALVVKSVERVTDSLTIELARGVIVEGHVTAVRGRRPLESASVTLVSEGRRSAVITDAEGLFRIRDVSPGKVHVSVTHPDYAAAELDATVSATGRADRPFELPAIDLAEAGSVEGQVVDNQGKPVSGARVAVGVVPAYLPAGSLPPGMTTTDGKGHFTLQGLAAGKVDLEAYAPDLGRGSLGGVVVSSGRTTGGLTVRLTAAVADDDATISASVAITLGERGSGDDLDVVIVHVAAASEAERAGLHAGDVIYAVDGVDVANMHDARARLSGRAGSDVVVEVGRGGESLKLRLTREQVRR
jgi:S1-C subfamily serine protease